MDAALHELRARGEGIDKSGASSSDVECTGVAAELSLDETRLGDEKLVRGTGGDDDQINVFSIKTCGLERLAGRRRTERRCRVGRADDSTFFNAGATDNP